MLSGVNVYERFITRLPLCARQPGVTARSHGLVQILHRQVEALGTEAVAELHVVEVVVQIPFNFVTRCPNLNV